MQLVKKSAIVFGLGILLAAQSALAAHYAEPMGVGVVIGEPSGITAKYWRDANSAFDAGFSYSFASYFQIDADYLYHWPGVFGDQDKFVSQLTPYIGGGLELLVSTVTAGPTNETLVRANGNSVGLGIRFPLGLEWRPDTPPIGVFAEIVPVLGIVPGTFGYLEAGVGARWYF